MGLKIGEAIEAAKEGKLITREQWRGQDVFIFLRPSDEITKDVLINQVKSLPQSVKDHYNFNVFHRENGHNLPPNEVKIKFSSYLCMKAADHSIMNGWHPTDEDIAAEDWRIIE